MGHSIHHIFSSLLIVKVLHKLLKSRVLWLFLITTISILSLFQVVLFLIVKYGISDGELQVAQDVLDARLFQSLDPDSDLGQKLSRDNRETFSKTYTPSKFFCGFPVPKDVEGIKDKSGLLGAIVLLKGAISPIISTRGYSLFPQNTTSLSPLDFDVYASVLCAQKLISNLPNPMLSRYMTFLERTVSVKISPNRKDAFSESTFCSSRSPLKVGGDLTAHSLVRAFALASQVGMGYQSFKTLAPHALNLHIFTATKTAQSRLEALALLTALLTTWAGDDEQQFQAYLKALQPTSVTLPGLGKPIRRYKWLEDLENPRFCVPTATFSCACPRLLLVHSLAQRRRTMLMASLRSKILSLHATLLPTLHRLAYGDAQNARHPEWPYRVLTLLSEALCNRTVPLSAVNSLPIAICDDEPTQPGCIGETAVQRLWDITSLVERALRSSEAQREYAKLSSYPFLRIVEQAVAKAVGQTQPLDAPWLHVYSGQPDSVDLLLQALNISARSTDQQRVAERLVVEILRRGPTLRLRFLLDGVDIGEALKPLGFCTGEPPVCSAEMFLAFMKGPAFWGAFATADAASSEAAFTSFCASADIRNLK